MTSADIVDTTNEVASNASSASSISEVDIPDQIRDYIAKFYSDFRQKKAFDLVQDYEFLWNKLSDKYYPKDRWPEPEQIAFIIHGVTLDFKKIESQIESDAAVQNAEDDEDDEDDGERLFFILYRELYFRHVYAKLHPTIEDRIDSYGNYVELFNLILSTDIYADIELPSQWLWDIIDEFIYQFQSASKHRCKVNHLSESEIDILRERIEVWNIHNILNVLYSLVQKSHINEQLIALKNDETLEKASGSVGSKPLYKMLGYFSLIGLLRVNCLVGDYTLALKSIEYIELNKKSIIPRVNSCHITTYYYLSFAYMMMRRYTDAIKSSVQILNFISKLHGRLHNNRGYQFDEIIKKSDQCYAILAICVSLHPQRIEESVHAGLRDKHSETLQRLSKGGAEALKSYEELFNFACPKCISPVNPDYSLFLELKAKEVNEEIKENEPATEEAKSVKKLFSGNEVVEYQRSIFLKEVATQLLIPTIRSYMKLYSTLEVSKLASFLNLEPEEVATQLIVLKHKSRQLVWSSGSAIGGNYQSSSDLDFYIKGGLIYISEAKHGRKIGDWFVRNINKLEDLSNQPYAQQQQQLQYQQQLQQGSTGITSSNNLGNRRRGGKFGNANANKARLNSNRLGRSVGAKKPRSQQQNSAQPSTQQSVKQRK